MNKNTTKPTTTFSGQARELKMKAEIDKLQKELLTSEQECKQLVATNKELREANIYLRGQVEAYERVLSHMIYNDNASDNSDGCGCEESGFVYDQNCEECPNRAQCPLAGSGSEE